MAKLATQWLTNFSQGMDSDISSVGTKPTATVASIQNFDLLRNGRIRVRKGFVRAHAAALNGGTAIGGTGTECYGVRYFRTSGGSDKIVAFFGRKAYASSASTVSWSEIASGLTEAYWSFATMTVAGVNYLICANGSTTMYTWDGTTWGTLTGPTTGVKFIATHNNRLWVSTGSSTVYASKIADFNTWTTPDGLSLSVNTNDGDDITALFSLGPQLLVFKRRSVSYIEGYGNSDIVVAAGSVGITNELGTPFFRTIVSIDGSTAMWTSPRGIEIYTIGGKPQIASERIKDLFDTLWDPYYILGTTGVPHAVYDPVNRKYTLIPYPASRLAINICLNNNSAVTYDSFGAGTITAMCTGPRSASDSKEVGVWYGTDAGFVCLANYKDAYLDDMNVDLTGGTAFSAIVTPAFRISDDPNMRARTLWIDAKNSVGSSPTSGTSMSVLVASSYGTSTSASITVPSSTGATAMVRKRVMVSVRGNIVTALITITSADRSLVTIDAIGMDFEIYGARTVRKRT